MNVIKAILLIVLPAVVLCVPARSADAPPATLAVFDPHGAVAARLKAEGVSFQAIGTSAAIDRLPADVRTLVVGPNALTDPEAKSDKWRDLVERGVRLLVLEQVYPNRPLRGPAIAVEHTWLWESDKPIRLDPASAAHPIFAGVDPAKFEKWSAPGKFVPLYGLFRENDVSTFDPNGKDQYVTELTPASVLTLATSTEASIYSAVLVYPAGKGTGVLCQLPVGERLADDPIAQKIFDNLLAYTQE